MALQDYQTLVDSLVRDDSGAIATTDRDRALALAVLRYSQDVPRDLVQDVVWAAAGHVGPLPTGWVEGVSTLLELESPPDQRPRAVLEGAVYVSPDGQALMLEQTRQAGAVVRVSYSAPHVLAVGGDEADTVPLQHREALAKYAAHLLCQQLATKYSGEREASIGADHSNTESRARNYAARARDYRAGYYAGIGQVDPQMDKGGSSQAPGQAPASSVGVWPGRRRLGFGRGL